MFDICSSGKNLDFSQSKSAYQERNTERLTTMYVLSLIIAKNIVHKHDVSMLRLLYAEHFGNNLISYYGIVRLVKEELLLIEPET